MAVAEIESEAEVLIWSITNRHKLGYFGEVQKQGPTQTAQQFAARQKIISILLF
jgi:hypothetical protein